MVWHKPFVKIICFYYFLEKYNINREDQDLFAFNSHQKAAKANENGRLKREIVATQIANDMVNNMGISFAERLMESTGASVGDVAKAYISARDVYQMEKFVVDLASLDYKVPAQIQSAAHDNLVVTHGIGVEH